MHDARTHVQRDGDEAQISPLPLSVPSRRRRNKALRHRALNENGQGTDTSQRSTNSLGLCVWDCGWVVELIQRNIGAAVDKLAPAKPKVWVA